MRNRILAFLGAGRMAEALIAGLLRGKVVTAERIIATSRRPERRELLRATYGIRVSEDIAAAAREADVVVLAAKPQATGELLARIAPAVDTHQLVLSIAAGVPTAVIERWLVPGARVVRAMPNTPALVGLGAGAVAGGTHATGDDLETACALLGAVGTTVILEEGLLDAVTGLSGSGPAYVFLMIEALSEAGTRMGLPEAVALQLAAQTVLGAAKLLVETGAQPAALRGEVASPGGTTVAGLSVLEAAGFRTALHDAVEAATRRSREIGDQSRDGL